jgi:Cu(I)/Ag(I) efflux system periplasmic protein CusF
MRSKQHRLPEIDMKRHTALLAALLVAAAPVFAQTPKDKDQASDHARAGKDANGAFSEGEVRKVDKPAGKVTIKHGPLANLDMPPMTMVFRVKDPAILDKVKQGDNIRFKADKVDGNYTVTELQAAK